MRGYSDRPVRDAAVGRILEAGRIAGRSRNRQPWRFLVVGNPGVRERVAEAVFAPGNVRGAALVVVVAVRGGGSVVFGRWPRCAERDVGGLERGGRLVPERDA